MFEFINLSLSPCLLFFSHLQRPSKPKKVQQSKADLFYDTLSDLKHRVAYVETNLEKALVETTNDSRRAKEVNTLVKEVSFEIGSKSDNWVPEKSSY